MNKQGFHAEDEFEVLRGIQIQGKAGLITDLDPRPGRAALRHMSRVTFGPELEFYQTGWEEQERVRS